MQDTMSSPISNCRTLLCPFLLSIPALKWCFKNIHQILPFLCLKPSRDFLQLAAKNTQIPCRGLWSHMASQPDHLSRDCADPIPAPAILTLWLSLSCSVLHWANLFPTLGSKLFWASLELPSSPHSGPSQQLPLWPFSEACFTYFLHCSGQYMRVLLLLGWITLCLSLLPQFKYGFCGIRGFALVAAGSLLNPENSVQQVWLSEWVFQWGRWSSYVQVLSTALGKVTYHPWAVAVIGRVNSNL
jgi:hypothetical protein